MKYFFDKGRLSINLNEELDMNVCKSLRGIIDGYIIKFQPSECVIDLKDVSLDELENDDALMYNKDTEKWENTDLGKPVGESVNKYLNEAVIDGGSAPTP